MEIKKYSPSKRSFKHRIHSLQRRTDATESADIISLVCGSSVVIESESRSRIEYLIPTNNILVFDSCFNLTNKFNVIGRL